MNSMLVFSFMYIVPYMPLVPKVKNANVTVTGTVVLVPNIYTRILYEIST